jgi:hypothetical protein
MMTVSSVSAESAFLAGAVCAAAMLAATAMGIAHNTVTMRLLAELCAGFAEVLCASAAVEAHSADTTDGDFVMFTSLLL